MRKLQAAVAVGVVVVGLTGCGAAAEKAAEEATERAVEDATGGSAEVDLDGGEVQVDTEDGSFSAGSAEIPEEWPDDVPVLDEIVVVSSLFSADSGAGDITTISGSSALTPEELVDAYRDALPDWELEVDGTQAGDGGTFASVVFVNGERRFTVGAASGEGADTAVNLSHTTGAP